MILKIYNNNDKDDNVYNNNVGFLTLNSFRDKWKYRCMHHELILKVPSASAVITHHGKRCVKTHGSALQLQPLIG